MHKKLTLISRVMNANTEVVCIEMGLVGCWIDGYWYVLVLRCFIEMPSCVFLLDLAVEALSDPMSRS